MAFRREGALRMICRMLIGTHDIVTVLYKPRGMAHGAPRVQVPCHFCKGGQRPSGEGLGRRTVIASAAAQEQAPVQ